MIMRRAIFIDLDGTLFDNRKEVSARNKRAIKATMDAGHEVVLCTARSVPFVKVLMGELGLRYAVCCCGGIVYDGEEDRILFEKTLPTEILEQVLKLAEDYEYAVSLPAGKRTFRNYEESPKRDRYSDEMEVFTEPLEEFLKKVRPAYLSLYSFSFADFRKLYLDFVEAGVEIESIAKELVENDPRPRPGIHKGVYYIEMTAPNISKGSGLRFMLEHLGLGRESAVAIGDSYNDLSMFRECDTRVAMGNAIVALKEVATHVVARNEDDGVAEFLESL